MEQADFQKFYDEFKQEQAGDFHFELVAEMIRLDKIKGNTIYLKPQNEFSRDNFKKRYLLSLQNKLITRTENQLLEVLLEQPSQQNNPLIQEQTVPSQREFALAQLPQRSADNVNRELNFGNYIEGEHNQFAISVAKAIVKESRNRYNPFFIYGSVGLGKTHLLHAIGNASKEKYLKVLYTNAESFFNNFMHAIRNQKQDYFKKKYRSVDILLIDDIHDLQDKHKTQDELFYIFNQFHEENKQLIFSCDRPAHELKNFSERLQSRLKSGINAIIGAPSYEVRRAIIQARLRQLGLKISPEVQELLATHVTDSIRDIYGAIEKLQAYAELMDRGGGMDASLAAQELQEYFGHKQPPLTARSIQIAVAEYYKLSLGDIVGKSRTRNVVLPRQVAMLLCREKTGLSASELGHAFGGRDHSTILHGAKIIRELSQKDPQFASELETLKKAIACV